MIALIGLELSVNKDSTLAGGEEDNQSEDEALCEGDII